MAAIEGIFVPNIVPYDPEWSRLFEAERERLLAVFAGASVVIEHVGSTAVPGLAAKPIIDIMVGVRELSHLERAIPALERLG